VVKYGRSILKKLGVVASAGALLSVLGFVAPASAAPSGCGVWRDNEHSGKAICSDGVGQVRVFLNCWDPVHDFIGTQYGPWVGVNQWSSATCLGQYASTNYPGGVDYETR